MIEPPPGIQLQVTPGRPALALSQDPQLAYLLVEAQPPALPDAHVKLPINICLVLDRSSSMRGERLHQVKEAALHIINKLSPNDFFSVVVFNDRAEVIVPCQRPTDKEEIRRAIGAIEARGGTEIATGLDLGIQEMERALVTRCISRLILLTDGRTYGDEGRCVELARMAQRRGIGITALGVGQEWNEDLLETIAAAENSRTEYITSAQEIFAAFAGEIERLSSIVAQSVELILLARPGLQIRSVYRVRPFISPLAPATLAESQWRLTFGDWASLDPQAVLLELVLPALPPGPQPFLRLELRYILPALGPQQQHTVVDCTLPVLPREHVSYEVDATVRYWLERTVAHRLQAVAWDQVAAGQIEDATRKLRMAGTRLFDAGEAALAQTLQEEATRLLRMGSASEEGRKRIRYGTRGLLARPDNKFRK